MISILRTKFRIGQLIITKQEDDFTSKLEIGKIRRMYKDHALVHYHSGIQLEKVEYYDMYPISNEEYITETSLGENRGRFI